MTDEEYIKNISSISTEELFNSLEYYGYDSYYAELWEATFEELKKRIEERPKGEWIPVSERLPTIDAENGWKASDVVLVCLADGKMHMGFYCEDNKWRFCDSGEANEPFWKDVIAWMPLPEPYKEEE